jgi:hypothetical protein
VHVILEEDKLESKRQTDLQEDRLLAAKEDRVLGERKKGANQMHLDQDKTKDACFNSTNDKVHLQSLIHEVLDIKHYRHN